ncbi:MAG: cytochrome d ubiquinol oxidase subunit II [Deltaproteobacteria bacterium]|nr:cytochrome d ubiquinol oxidase subunit II [Deltaproteobacteria bacterium]
MLGALVIYALTGGADFGGGVWDLLATGPRARAQRRLIESALGPIWEANHVWLILVVVILFTAFPLAFSAATTALHIPLTALLVGIVLRGSAFVFRAYGSHTDDAQRSWGRVFAVASVASPVFLGVTLGAVSSGALRVGADGVPTCGFFDAWLAPFPFAVGFFALSLFAFLAAVYLANETDDADLQADFRARALWAGGVVALAAVMALVLWPSDATRSMGALLRDSSWAIAVVVAACVSGAGAVWALTRGRFQWARGFAALEVALVLVGWGLTQQPFLIAPDVSIARAAAPPDTLKWVLIALATGTVVLVPSFVWLFRVFKSKR